MGEAKRRRDALRWGAPLPQDFHVCPKCGSRDTVTAPMPAELAMSHIATLGAICRTCKTFWEAYPPGWSHDVVGAEPCDNCAFRPGSPEIADRAEWRDMLAKLKAGQEFRCHKGAPIIADADGKMEFDEAWVQKYGRTCAGFHRAVMTQPGWLERRFGLPEGDSYVTAADLEAYLDEERPAPSQEAIDRAAEILDEHVAWVGDTDLTPGD